MPLGLSNESIDIYSISSLIEASPFRFLPFDCQVYFILYPALNILHTVLPPSIQGDPKVQRDKTSEKCYRNFDGSVIILISNCVFDNIDLFQYSNIQISRVSINRTIVITIKDYSNGSISFFLFFFQDIGIDTNRDTVYLRPPLLVLIHLVDDIRRLRARVNNPGTKKSYDRTCCFRAIIYAKIGVRWKIKRNNDVSCAQVHNRAKRIELNRGCRSRRALDLIRAWATWNGAQPSS